MIVYCVISYYDKFQGLMDTLNRFGLIVKFEFRIITGHLPVILKPNRNKSLFYIKGSDFYWNNLNLNYTYYICIWNPMHSLPCVQVTNRQQDAASPYLQSIAIEIGLTLKIAKLSSTHNQFNCKMPKS